MILRKSMSAFLRNLRAVPDDRLPALPAKKLTVRQYKKLEDAVFSRITQDSIDSRSSRDTRSIPIGFDAPAAEAGLLDDVPYERVPVDGRDTWKQNLRRYLGASLAACLCFAVLVTGVFFRGDIAMYFAQQGWYDGTETVTDHEDTQAIHMLTGDDLPETGVAPPYENADGLPCRYV